jgi:RimJ/RimL family protein N-acetyltransferase
MLPLKTLRDEVLTLRPFTEEDVDGYFELHRDPVATRYTTHCPYTERQQAVEKVARMLAWQRDTDTFQWVITRGSNDFLGCVSLFEVKRDQLRCEVGYDLLPRVQGQGLATRAVRLALVHAFDVEGFERIEADVDPRHTASLKLVERLGFRREGLLRERWRVPGELADSVLLGLLKREFIR